MLFFSKIGVCRKMKVNLGSWKILVEENLHNAGWIDSLILPKSRAPRLLCLKIEREASFVQIPENDRILEKASFFVRKFLSPAGCNGNKFEVNVFSTLLRAPDGNVARFSTFSPATGLFQRITRCKPRTLANFGHQIQGSRTNRYEHMGQEIKHAGARDSQIQRRVEAFYRKVEFPVWYSTPFRRVNRSLSGF